MNLQRLTAAKKVGLLFSGGSSRCIFQVGVVETLYALGVRPAMCLGVSGGAWNAAAAVGNWRRLRSYWRFFSRMPVIDLTNLFREHSRSSGPVCIAKRSSVTSSPRTSGLPRRCHCTSRSRDFAIAHQ